ncbi:hypothetical protein ACM614_30510 [Streptomyces sp. 12297]|uniref:hypothetical protein n=1 Tax=Streptomyces sp. NBC_00239 TaxID=2903640 RepID=UPI002E2A0A0B|nr:hypothetical protein [Streptomyces sp. NBC_00239]
MNFLFLVLVPACMALAAVTCVLARRLPLWLRAIAVLAVLAAVVVWFFASRGTLDGYPSPGICGPDNVPPWWPDWLPA